jgi:predicted glycosyltransferase
MRVLFDVLHPAHVHFFRAAATEVQAEGGEVLFTARHKDVTIQLLEQFQLPYEVHSRIGGGTTGLALELARRSAKMLRTARRFRPDLLAGIMGPVIAPMGHVLRVPSLVFYDTETATLTNRYVLRLATEFAVPEPSFAGLHRRNLRRYPGYQALAYLHPKRFSTTDADVEGIDLPERFALVRLVSWEASHDIGDQRAGDPVQLVRELAREIPVVLSTERAPPAELADLVIPFAPDRLHHVLARASLYLGEGGTTAIEAAMLGTPAVMLHPRARVFGVIRSLEDRDRLLRTAGDCDSALAAARAMLELDPATWDERRAAMLDRCVELSGWMLERFSALTAAGEGARARV